MSKALTNPLQSIIKQAAATLPASTGKVATQQARINRRTGETVILVDVSISMDGPAWGAQRKIDVLRDAVDVIRQRQPCKLIAFSAAARDVERVPEPEANTDLVAGLKAAQAHDPGITLVISDGLPDNEHAALDVARTFRGAIDVLYIGPEGESKAIAFMRRLAATADGNVTINDISNAVGVQRLTHMITAMLPAPRN